MFDLFLSQCWITRLSTTCTLLFAAAVSAPLIPASLLADEVPVKKIDLSVPADHLPYLLGQRLAWGGVPQNAFGLPVDWNGDGVSEDAFVYSDPYGDGAFRSAVVAVSGFGGKVLFQYNGPYPNRKILSFSVRDVMGGPGEEVILLKAIGDTAVLEIVGLDERGEMTSQCLVAAVGTGMRPGESWHDLHIYPLAGLDVNGDGAKDLIYSRSAKPDSAFDRGLVAYDLKNRRVIWFFPLADMVGANWSSQLPFRIVQRPGCEPVMVFAVPACMNRYAANGMDSEHAYLVAINTKGRELWRRTLGGPGFLYPTMVWLDVNGDGTEEILAPTYSVEDGNPISSIINCYDPYDGRCLASSEPLPGGISALCTVIHGRQGDDRAVVCVVGDGKIELVSLDRQLRVRLRGIGDVTGIAFAADLNGDSLDEIVSSTPGGGTCVLSREFELLASSEWGGTISVYRTDSAPKLLLNNPTRGFGFLTLEKQNLIALIWNRYNWWLVVPAAAGFLYLLLILARWVMHLYRSSAGLPSLDRLNALVVVLNRKGRILFFNHHSLLEVLLGKSPIYRQALTKTAAIEHPALMETINKSFHDPYLPVQAQFEIGNGDQGARRIDLVVYPRLDRHNSFVGKILIAEDVTDRVDWERKVVLGEAAQRWVHKLKGNMATARITLDNLREDQRVSGMVASNHVLNGYLQSVNDRITETAETANKILRFLRISKPEKIACDINRLIARAVQPYQKNHLPGITVAIMPQSGLPLVTVDPEQMMEVFDNLLSNAVAAVGNAGKITVHSRLADDLHAAGNRMAVEITVEDTGKGVDQADRDKIFVPGFSRTANGTGIGLAIVKEIIDNHGGKITVDSAPGKGSRFVISIPSDGGNA